MLQQQQHTLSIFILALTLFYADAQFSAKFLVAVNATSNGPNGCVAIISTDSIKIGFNETIRVGNCDSGPISYTLKQNKNPGIWQHFSRNTIQLTFHSNAVLDASPPTCQLHFNETYIAPKPSMLDKNGIYSPLPSCYTEDSREGYHLTYYWFYLLELTRCENASL